MAALPLANVCFLLHRPNKAWHLAMMRGPAWVIVFSAMVRAVRGDAVKVSNGTSTPRRSKAIHGYTNNAYTTNENNHIGVTDIHSTQLHTETRKKILYCVFVPLALWGLLKARIFF